MQGGTDTEADGTAFRFVLSFLLEKRFAGPDRQQEKNKNFVKFFETPLKMRSYGL
jgi:hypothetical protein